MSSEETFHPVAWSAWLVAAALPALTTRNPLYLSLTLLAATVNYLALGRRSPLAQSWGAFVRLGAYLWLLTIPFTALTAHYGEIVLLRLPAHWPVIGGPVTAEALIYGTSSGLALLTLLLVFAVFNVAVDQARLLRMVPAFMYQAGVVTAIAVAFVPQMVAAWQEIRQVQQMRGHRVRGLRDLLPLIMPLLITALERAMQLAESMEARGFGGQFTAGGAGRGIGGQVAVLFGLAGLGVGFAGLGFWPERRLVAALLVAGGVAALAGAFWEQGRHVRRSHYRRWHWHRADRVVLLVSLVGAAIWALAWLVRDEWFFFYPYPPYAPWPTFQPLLGLVIMALATPGLLLPPRR